MTNDANIQQGTPNYDELEAQLKQDEINRLEPVESTTEEPEEPVEKQDAADAPEQAETKEDAKPDESEFEKRISRMAFEKRQAEKNARALQERLDRLEGKAPPLPKDEEVAQLVEQRAAEMAKIAAYNEKANTIYKAGMNEYPDFELKLKDLRELGGISPEFVEAADEAGDAHKIIAYLSRNLDEAERVMQMPPHKMGAALGKIGNRLVALAAAKPQSKAPAPIKPIGGKAKAELSDDNMSIDEFMKREDEKMFSRRR
jgi:hypothetical protein